jgi:cytochrome c oxidase subunit II
MMRHTSIACGMLMLLVAPLLASGHQDAPASPKVIHVVAERFVFTPSEITVDEESVVELRLTSEDTSHGFRIIGPGGINVEIPKRGRGDIRVTFEAHEPGEYTFECSRVCGAGHNFMRGTLRVKARRAPSITGGESK